ncbi:MAG TPA: tripartite tricarboxylate transporter substrate binding protein [Xanthobacteraceae bacterium]|nr:tripartite tricarboxylate transporter substrate binding protein [Xanthobacteraceae bacterium]
MFRFAGFVGLIAAASIALWSAPSPAQEPYPSRTVKIVVPAIAGSTTDTLARIVADQLSQKWGKATIVENIPGGAMNIGALSVARAAPDGYTLLIAPPSPLSFNHLLYRDPGYEPTKFVPITMLAKIPNVLVVRNELAASSLKELVAYAKANPGKLSYASQGVGSTAHLSAAQLEARAGIKMVHVPYRGAQPALTDVVAGHVDMFFDTLATSVPLYRDNKLKLLGVADVKRAGAGAGDPHDFRSWSCGFQVDHLVRFGRTAGHACGVGRKDQPRCGQDPEQQGCRRHAAQDVARGRRNGACRDHPLLCRGIRVVEQGDQGSQYNAAVSVCFLRQQPRLPIGAHSAGM